MLLKRVRMVAQTQYATSNASGIPADVLLSAAAWSTPSMCLVSPCWVFSPLLQCFQAVFKSSLYATRTATLVSAFLGKFGSLDFPSQPELSVSATSLFPVSCRIQCSFVYFAIIYIKNIKRTVSFQHFCVEATCRTNLRRRKRVLHDPRAISVGSILSLANNAGRPRKLVLVVEVQFAINHQAVSLALDKHRFFAMGHNTVGKYRSKEIGWHAARIHHHCRLLDPPEQPCEHVGSLLHGAWNPSQNYAPQPLIDQALLKHLRRFKYFSINVVFLFVGNILLHAHSARRHTNREREREAPTYRSLFCLPGKLAYLASLDLLETACSSKLCARFLRKLKFGCLATRELCQYNKSRPCVWLPKKRGGAMMDCLATPRWRIFWKLLFQTSGLALPV